MTVVELGVFGGSGLLALALYTWGMGATFESSDQAAMAYLVQHSFGIKWLFAHCYGPVLPVIQRTFAELLSRLHLPITESAYRFPLVAIGLAQVVLTFPLMRRLRCTRAEALAGMACCAVLPTLVSNAHLAWSHMSVWLFSGSLALWATLAYLEDHRRWQLLIAGAALCAHCTCSAYAMALPVTLGVAWWSACRHPRSTSGSTRWDQTPPPLRAALVAFLIPCMVALVVIVGSWLWTGQGQIAHLLGKHDRNHTGLHVDQIGLFPKVWSMHVGYLFAPLAAAGLVFGLISAWRGLIRRPGGPGGAEDRAADLPRGLLGLWAGLGLVPVLLLVEWQAIGYAGAYLVESVYGGVLLAVMLMGVVYRRFERHPRWRTALLALGVLAVTHMGIGGADYCLAGGGLHRYTGIQVEWGQIKPDTGVRAAGWYVRQHVPMDAVVLCLHTNKGMEAPVAEYYTGRRILASYDLPAGIVAPLLQGVAQEVDVVIANTTFRPLAESLAGFDCVCTIRNQGCPVRFIYARTDRLLPCVDEEVAVLNEEYARRYSPRHVPVPLPAAPEFDRAMDAYRQTLRRLTASD